MDTLWLTEEVLIVMLIAIMSLVPHEKFYQPICGLNYDEMMKTSFMS